MHEYYHKWYTQYLNRDMEMLVFGHSGFPLVLFPSFGGRFFDCKDNGIISILSEFIESGKLKVYCPDTIDNESWGNELISIEDRLKTHTAYERMIINDVIKFSEYETGISDICLAGLGFGGYHSVNLALRNPNLVGFAFSYFGVMNIKRYLHEYYDENCYFNNPVDYMVNLDNTWYLDNLKWMEIILTSGKNDDSFEDNCYLSKVLYSKEIGHKFDIVDKMNNEWSDWAKILPSYLNLIPSVKK